MQYARYTNTITVITCFLLFALVLLAGCVAPFSDLQSAKTVGKGKAEITPSFSAVYFEDDLNDTGHIQDHLGLQAAIGMSEKVDLRLRFERITVDKDGESPFNVLAFGPKIGIAEDIIALNLPVGFVLHEGTEASDTWQFHPTLLLTLISGDTFEINTSVKALVPLKGSEDSDTLIAFNLGMGVSTDIEKWAIRPEFGVLINPGEDGRFMHFSVGLAVYP